ncbi:hypothetical protein FT663_03788 [Candidozyma haemuli var. vulneris]|nr:hypothetical protein FT662_04517 [[Candida] haemuloni var. vulneris]KAF3989045.1 hypothetical protein FT663_03788 [[Candida] haemuloni var. vulneris]
MGNELHHADYSSFGRLSKREVLEALQASYEALAMDTSHWVSNLANAASLLWYAYRSLEVPINWAGFYVVDQKTEGDLVLGPFQGKVACQSITLGKGVCGVAALTKTTQCVPDVSKFPGHIACDGETQSEIVVPIISGNDVVAVLDIDCLAKDAFNKEDEEMLESLARLISSSNKWHHA